MLISFHRQLLCLVVFFIRRTIIFILRVWSMSWQRSTTVFFSVSYYLMNGRPVHASAPVYNTGADFPHPHRFTMSRPSESPLMLRSSLSSISRGPVYINTPGRTCLHELFIEYEQVTAWVAGFLPTNWKKIIIIRRLRWRAQWTCVQVAATPVWLASN